MRYASATECIPEPVFIAGTQLRPFSLGHHLLFKRLSLPFAGSWDADCGEAEILLGIFICAQSYEETLAQLHSGEWNTVQEKWLVAVAKRKTKLADVEKRFRAYLKTGYELPPLWSHKGVNGIRYSAPWEQLLKVRLVMSGFTETEVLNGYLPARWYDYHTACELNAADSCDNPKFWKPIFWTAEDAAKMEEARRV